MTVAQSEEMPLAARLTIHSRMPRRYQMTIASITAAAILIPSLTFIGEWYQKPMEYR